MNTQTGLRILLLGTPMFMNGEQPVDIPGRLQRNLLCYLACQNGPVPRERLLELFWPEELESDQRKHLRETLSKLRSSLGDLDPLIAENDWLMLDESRVSVDAREFQRLSRQIGRDLSLLTQRPLPQGVYEMTLNAVKLWRSSEFMTGAYQPNSTEFDEWLRAQRMEYQTSRRALLERLAKHEHDIGNLEAARRWLLLALEDDEYNADLQFEMLSVLNDLGWRAEAVKYTVHLNELYDDYSQAEMLPELRALIEKVRAESNLPPHPKRTLWPATLNLNIPFIGREDLLKTLQRQYMLGGVAVIYGEAGSGKSRLLYEFYHNANPAPRLIWIAPTPARANLPFDALSQALRVAVQPEEWHELDLASASRLSLLLPELLINRYGVKVVPQEPPKEARRLLFEALHKLFCLLSRNQRVLVFLDDSQWCDPDTMDALTYLIERTRYSGHGLLVIASRLEERNQQIEKFLSRFRTAIRIPQLELPLLQTHEVGLLAERTLGISLPEEFIERLSRETGGNPLFLVETLRAILDAATSPENLLPARLPLASSMTALVRERLTLMRPASQQVLYAAAILGNEFTPEMLETTTELNAQTVVDALEELERLRMVRPTPSETWATSYSFIHEKIREILVVNLSPARRRLLHKNAARALEEFTAITIPSAMIAVHYEAAGENAKAAERWIKAAVHARRFYSYTEAIQLFEKAEQMLIAVSQPTLQHLQYRLYTAWGDMAMEMCDPTMLDSCANNLLQSGYFFRDSRLIGNGLLQQGHAAYLRQQEERAVQFYDRALPYLEESGLLAEWLHTCSWRGMALLGLGRFQQSADSYRQALQLGADSLDPRILVEIVNARSQLASLLILMGQPAEAEKMAAEAMQDCLNLSNNFLIAQGYSMLAAAQYYNGKYEQALQNCQAGLEYSEEQNNTWLVSFGYYLIGVINLALGNLDEAWQHLQSSIQLAEQKGHENVRCECLCALADLYRMSGSLPEAIQCCNSAIEGGGEAYHHLDAMYRLGYILISSGDVDHGLKLVEEAVENASKMNFGLVSIPGHAALASLYADLGKFEDAQREIAQVESLPTANQGNFPFVIRYAQVMIAIRKEEYRQALKMIEAILPDLRLSGNCWMIGMTLEALIHIRRAMSLPVEDVLEEVQKILDHLAAGARQEPMLSLTARFRQSLWKSLSE